MSANGGRPRHIGDHPATSAPAVVLADPARIATMSVDQLPGVQQEITTALVSLAAAAAAVSARLLAVGSAAAPGNSEGLLDVREAAGRLGMSADWLYRHAKRLPFTRRVGRRALKFDAEGLARWIAAQRRG